MVVPSEIADSGDLLPVSASPRNSKNGLRRLGVFIGCQFDRAIGFATMTVCLAAVSAIPVLNLLSLGFLLESSARVARSGRLRDGFIGLPNFAKLGKVILGIWIWTLPIRLVHSFWRDAELIQDGSKQANGLRIFLAFLIVVTTLHLIAAIFRGGRLRHFMIPAPLQWIRWMSVPSSFPRITGMKQLAKRLAFRFLQLGKLGFLGFLGAAIWLALPVCILFMAARAGEQGPAFLVALLGSALLGIAALLTPFLQTRFAVTHRFRDFFAVSEARRLFRNAPLAFWLALVVTLLFALPLYLLKIELTPREVAWLPNLIFVLFILPARLVLGWAISRAGKAQAPRKWPSRWISGLGAIPVVAAYVLVVWLSQYLSWHGTYSLLEQHAFLVPAPLFGL